MKLLRGNGPVIRVGHRGAAALAPENTLRSFEVALEAGVDAIEFDVLDLPRGPLVLAHSNDLYEVSHGAATGLVSELTLGELREVAPALPTLDEALEFIAARDGVSAHVDLELAARLDELGAALRRHGLEGRTIVSGFHVPSLQEVARHAAVRIGRTYPADRYGVARRRVLRPVVRAGVVALRASLARRLHTLLPAGASALMLHHAVVSHATVARAHELGAAVWAWTVDEPAEVERVAAAGVDAVITNDPAMLVATLRA